MSSVKDELEAFTLPHLSRDNPDYDQLFLAATTLFNATHKIARLEARAKKEELTSQLQASERLLLSHQSLSASALSQRIKTDPQVIAATYTLYLAQQLRGAVKNQCDLVRSLLSGKKQELF